MIFGGTLPFALHWVPVRFENRTVNSLGLGPKRKSSGRHINYPFSYPKSQHQAESAYSHFPSQTLHSVAKVL